MYGLDYGFSDNIIYFYVHYHMCSCDLNDHFGGFSLFLTIHALKFHNLNMRFDHQEQSYKVILVRTM